MLSVPWISRGSIENHYYRHQDGGYFLESVHETKLYQWMGRGAERLGLVGQVDFATHQKVFTGELPNGIVVGKHDQNGRFVGRSGLGPTFSLNKELSLIICCTEDKALRETLLDAHINAVKTVVTQIERLAVARQTVRGEQHYISTNNLIVSLCTHFSSRAGDPQVHTHALVANITQRPDGQWRTLATDLKRRHGFFEKLRDCSAFYGHIYQNEMERAARALGFQTRPTNQHGMFEVVGFPAEMKAHFSQRRQQIEKCVASMTGNAVSRDGATQKTVPYRSSYTEKKLFEQVAQHSKGVKEKVPTNEFIKRSQLRMAAWLTENQATQNGVERDKVESISLAQTHPINTTGRTEKTSNRETITHEISASRPILDESTKSGGETEKNATENTFDALVSRCRSLEKEPSVIVAGDAMQSLHDAVESLSAFQVTFDANRLIEKALTFRGDASFLSLQAALNTLLQNNTLLMTESGRLTSQALRDRETDFIQQVKSASTVSKRMRAGFSTVSNASSTQTPCVAQLGITDCLNAQRLCVLKEPRTLLDKVAFLETLAKELRTMGKKVTLLTQTASFAMEREAWQPSRKNFWQALRERQVDLGVEALPGFLHRYESCVNRFFSTFLMPKNREVFLVDGTQQMSLPIAERLIALTTLCQARVIFLAFEGGRSSPLASDALQLLIKAGVPVLSAANWREEKKPLLPTSPTGAVEKSAVGSTPITPHLIEVPLPLNVESNNANRQRERQQRIAVDMGGLIQRDAACFYDTQVFSLTRHSAERQSALIRSALMQAGKIADEAYDIITERRVHLDKQAREEATSFQVGWVVRTYAWRGRFIEKTITAIDKTTNQLTVRDDSLLARSRTCSPEIILKDSQSQLYARDKLSVATGDLLRLNAENRASREIGLVLNTTYRLEIADKQAVLTPLNRDKLGEQSKADNTAAQPIRLQRDRLNGLDIAYDYARSLQTLPSFHAAKKYAVLDAPLYALDKSVVSALGRGYSALTIYTDNREKAAKRIKLERSSPLATDLRVFPYKEKANLEKEAVDYGLAVVGSRQAAFLYDRVVSKAVRYYYERIRHRLSRNEEMQHSDIVASIEAVLDIRVDTGELSMREKKKPKPKGDRLDAGKLSEGKKEKSKEDIERWLATREALALEDRLIDRIREGKSTVNPLMEKVPLQTALEERGLTKGQRAACELIATTPDRFVMVQGYAGTGKSTMLKALTHVLMHDATVQSPITILALAPTHKAVKALRDKGMTAGTLKQFLVDAGCIDPIKSAQTLRTDENSQKSESIDIDKSAQKPLINLKNTLILLDEASMVSNHDMEHLQKLVESAKNCHCVYLGDVAQLTSVEAGKPYELGFISKVADMAVATMDEVLRQKNPELKAIVHDLMVATPEHVERAFDRLEKNGAFVEVEKQFWQYAHFITRDLSQSMGKQNPSSFYWYRDHRAKIIHLGVLHFDGTKEQHPFSKEDDEKQYDDLSNAINRVFARQSVIRSVKGLPKKLADDFKFLHGFAISHCQYNRFARLAKDYGKLSLKAQQQTLIGVATNAERDAVNREVRAVFSAQHMLTGEELTGEILIDSRLTDAELRYSANYREGDVLQLGLDYQVIQAIKQDQNTLFVVNKAGEQLPINLDWIPTNTVMACFHPKEIRIQAGDLLKWTKSDKERGLIAHDSFYVQSVNPKNGRLCVMDTHRRSFEIDLSLRHNQHLDYQYAATVYGLQGADNKRIFPLFSSGNELSNNLRLFYVACTRASQDITIYTDNLALIRRQIMYERGEKPSALETMQQLAIRQRSPSSLLQRIEPLKASNETCKEKASFFSASGKQSSQRLDAGVIESRLRDQVKGVCEWLLGKPNPNLSNENRWRYGSKGSLSVTVSNPYQGTFYNFETGEKGGMLALIKTQLDMDFKSALERGNDFLGGSGALQRLQGDPSSSKKGVSKASQKNLKTSAEKLADIQKIIAKSKPLSDTLAERYLKNRAIREVDCENLRFVPWMNTGGGNHRMVRFSPALLGIVKDATGCVKTIQTTYLDTKTGGKLSVPIPKRSHSSYTGFAIDLTPSIKKPSVAFIVEGIETALSIRDAISSENKQTAQVLVSLGKENFKNLGDATTANHFVLVADNDKTPWQQDTALQKAIQRIEAAGKSVTCIQPPLLNDKKTDYNDLAQAGQQKITAAHVEVAILSFEKAVPTRERLKSEKAALVSEDRQQTTFSASAHHSPSNATASQRVVNRERADS